MWRRLRKYLLPPRFDDQQQNQAAFLMHGVLLIMFVGVFIGAVIFATLTTAPGFAPLSTTTSLAMILLLALSVALRLLLERGYVRSVGALFSLALLIAVTANIRLNLGTIRNETVLAYPMIMFIATLVVGGRGSALFTLASMGAMTLLYSLEARGIMAPAAGRTPADLSTLTVYLLVLLIMGVLLQFADRVINVGFNQFRIITDELQTLSESLEVRVEERTRELGLAAEIGNAISQVRDVERLLADAVELIRSRYDLYYVQVYLVDPSEQYLVLRVGTGTVGRELVRQGHRLPIGPGSINGTAAAERHAIIVADTSTSLLFRPNSLLPNIRSEMSVPLVSNRRLIGVLGLQADEPETFTIDSLPAFETLASQLATAIQNASLFTQTRQAQAELAAQAERQARRNWEAYLNAIDRREVIGFEFDLDSLHPLDKPFGRSQPTDENVLEAPILIAGAEIGTIQIETSGRREFTDEQRELVQAVSEQVAQQVENLRLLDESERFRLEAEQALRRFSSEGWQSYLAATGLEDINFVYDGQTVSAVASAQLIDAEPAQLRQDLTIRDESVGQIEIVDEVADTQQNRELISAVASRLSAHIENLRLARQTELALADVQRRSEELALINQVVSAVASSLDLTQSMQLVVDELAEITNVDQVRIALLDDARSVLHIIAEHYNPEKSPSALGVVIPVEGNALTQEVMATRETVVVEDAQNAALTAPIHDLMRSQGIETLVVMPMLVGNEVIGTIGMDVLVKGQTVTPAQLRLAETIVFQAATAAQNARLFEQLETALGESQALYEISQALVSGHSVANIVQEVAEALVAHKLAPDIHNAALTSLEVDQNGFPAIAELVGWYFVDNSKPPLSIGSRFDIKDLNVTKLLAESPEDPLYIGDVTKDSRLDAESRRTYLWAGVNAAVLLPLRVANRWVGQFNLAWPEPHVFTDREKRIYRSLMGQIATTMDNQRLFQQTQARAAELGVINQVAETVSQQLDMDRLLLTVYNQVQRIMPVDWFHVGSYDEETNMIEYLVMFEVGEPQEKEPDELRKDSFTYRVVKNREPVLENLSREEIEATAAANKEHLLGREDQPVTASLIFVPLGLGEKVTGVLSVQSYEYNAYDQRDVTLLSGIATHLSVALDNANLFSQTQAALADAETQAQRLAQLNDLAAAFSQAESLNDVFQIASFQLNSILGGHRASMALLDDETEELVVHVFQGRAGAVPTGERLPLAGTSFGKAVKENQLMYFNDLSQSTFPDHKQLMETGVRSTIVVPLLARSRVIGTVNVGSFDVDAYDASDINLMRQVSALMASAIENRQLLSQAQRQAERERLVNQINQKITGALTMERAVRTAVEELGRALGVSRAQVDLSVGTGQEPAGGNGKQNGDA